LDLHRICPVAPQRIVKEVFGMFSLLWTLFIGLAVAVIAWLAWMVA
jgi:hypothetical protein